MPTSWQLASSPREMHVRNREEGERPRMARVRIGQAACDGRNVCVVQIVFLRRADRPADIWECRPLTRKGDDSFLFIPARRETKVDPTVELQCECYDG